MKYDTKRLEKECAELLEGLCHFENLDGEKSLSDGMPMDEFARRGYKFGTTAQAWRGLELIASQMNSSCEVSPDLCLWFVNAMNGLEKGDIKGLVRRLGFHEMGRSRVVNPHDIGLRMAELVEKRGLLKAEAARQCATEFKCSPSTALAWYAKRLQNVEN